MAGIVIFASFVILALIASALGLAQTIYDTLSKYIKKSALKKVAESIGTAAFIGLALELPKEEKMEWALYYMFIGIVFTIIAGYLEEE